MKRHALIITIKNNFISKSSKCTIVMNKTNKAKLTIIVVSIVFAHVIIKANNVLTKVTLATVSVEVTVVKLIIRQII